MITPFMELELRRKMKVYKRIELLKKMREHKRKYALALEEKKVASRRLYNLSRRDECIRTCSYERIPDVWFYGPEKPRRSLTWRLFLRWI